MKINLEKYSIELTIPEYVELVNLEGFDELLENLSSLEMASDLTKETITCEEECGLDCSCGCDCLCDTEEDPFTNHEELIKKLAEMDVVLIPTH